jgi:hypothetical protein
MILKNDRPVLDKEAAQHRQIRICQSVIRILLWAPDGARHQDGPTDWPADRQS